MALFAVAVLCVLASSCDSEEGTTPPIATDTGVDTGSGGNNAGAFGGGGSGPSGGGGTGGGCGQCLTLKKPGCCPSAKVSWTCTGPAEEDCSLLCNDQPIPLIWPLDDIEDTHAMGGGSPMGTGGQGGAASSDVQMRSVTFKSWQWDQAGQRTEIDIHGIIGVPQGGQGGQRAALLILHGLDSQAEPGKEGESIYPLIEAAAQTFDVVAFAISGPGVGESTGAGPNLTNGDKFCHLFSTDSDPRASWLFSYAVAAMRAITYLNTLSDEVYAGSIGVAGFSIGGTVALLVNGVDSRVKAVIPVSGVGDYAQAVDDHGWLDGFLDECSSSAAVKQNKLNNLSEYLDPLVYAQTMCGPAFILNGVHDEVFPLNATQNTYQALDAAFKERTTDQMVWWNIVPDMDHGYYANEHTASHEYCTRDLDDGNEHCETRKVADERVLNGIGYFMHHFVVGNTGAGGSSYAAIPTGPPSVPVCTPNSGGGAPTASCSIEVAPNTSLEVKKVRIWFADDEACMIANPQPTSLVIGDEYKLTQDSPGGPTFTNSAIELPNGKSLNELVYWSEVAYNIESMGNPVLFPGCPLWSSLWFNRVYFSSSPVLPTGFTPAIRPYCSSLSALGPNPCADYSCDPNPLLTNPCVHIATQL